MFIILPNFHFGCPLVFSVVLLACSKRAWRVRRRQIFAPPRAAFNICGPLRGCRKFRSMDRELCRDKGVQTESFAFRHIHLFGAPHPNTTAQFVRPERASADRYGARRERAQRFHSPLYSHIAIVRNAAAKKITLWHHQNTYTHGDWRWSRTINTRTHPLFLHWFAECVRAVWWWCRILPWAKHDASCYVL